MKLMLVVGAALTVAALTGCAGEGGQRPSSATYDSREISSSPYAGPVYEEKQNLSEAASINLQLGIEYMRRGRYELAESKLQKAASLNPKDAVAQNALGFLYEVTGRDDAAEQHYRKAIDLDKDYSQARMNYGSFLCAHGQAEQGIKDLRQAVGDTTYSERPRAFAELGICYVSIGQLTQAEESFATALDLEPRTSPALLGMAQVALTQGNTDRARGYVVEFETISAPTPDSLWIGYQVEQAAGNRERQSYYRSQLRKRYPQSQQAARVGTSGI